MIDTQEISVVVQGAISGKSTDPEKYQITKKVLLSIRKHLPGAEIILSTWKGSDVKGLDYDQLVESDDPGAVLLGEYKNTKVFNNLNRQIVSSKTGLAKVQRKYAIKTRTDVLFTGSRFLRYFYAYPKRADALKIFKSRIIAGTVYAPNPNRLSRKPFCPSDWFSFGLSEDVKDLWDIPLAPEPEFSLWFKKSSLPENRSDDDSMKYRPEQYIWLSCLRKHVSVPCEHQWDYGAHNRWLHELSLANNLILLHPREIGIKFTKYRFGILGRISFYHHLEWIELYKKYCDPDYPLPFNWRSPIQDRLSRWVERSPRFRHLLSWYDYRYVRLSQAWNSPNRLESFKKLLKK